MLNPNHRFRVRHRICHTILHQDRTGRYASYSKLQIIREMTPCHLLLAFFLPCSEQPTPSKRTPFGQFDTGYPLNPHQRTGREIHYTKLKSTAWNILVTRPDRIQRLLAAREGLFRRGWSQPHKKITFLAPATYPNPSTGGSDQIQHAVQYCAGAQYGKAFLMSCLSGTYLLTWSGGPTIWELKQSAWLFAWLR